MKINRAAMLTNDFQTKNRSLKLKIFNGVPKNLKMPEKQATRLLCHTVV